MCVFVFVCYRLEEKQRERAEKGSQLERQAGLDKKAAEEEDDDSDMDTDDKEPGQFDDTHLSLSVASGDSRTLWRLPQKAMLHPGLRT
jgi:hypothetical protein